MAWHQIFVNSGIAHLVAAETLASHFVAPNTDLGAELGVDFLDNILIFDNHLQRHNIASCVNPLICAGTTDERGFLGIRRIRFGNCANVDEGRE